MQYIDIISVDRDRGIAYIAWYSGVKDRWGSNTWETNLEVSLSEIEGILNKELPNGYLDEWVRIDNWSPHPLDQQLEGAE
jgi:hypothetical protein